MKRRNEPAECTERSSLTRVSLNFSEGCDSATYDSKFSNIVARQARLGVPVLGPYPSVGKTCLPVDFWRLVERDGLVIR